MPFFSLLCVWMQTLFLNNLLRLILQMSSVLFLCDYSHTLHNIVSVPYLNNFSHLSTCVCVSKSHCFQWNFSEILKLVLICFETGE